MSITGDRIRARRIELGLTQDELAERLGYASKTSVNKVETERTISLKLCEEYAKALECDPSYLAGWQIEVHREDTQTKLDRLLAYAEVLNHADKMQ